MSSRRTIADEMERLVQPDGLAVRRRRHDRGWSQRALVAAIEVASISASGLKRSLTPNQIEAIEERAERITYDALLLLADGLDCDPVDLLAADSTADADTTAATESSATPATLTNSNERRVRRKDTLLH